VKAVQSASKQMKRSDSVPPSPRKVVAVAAPSTPKRARDDSDADSKNPKPAKAQRSQSTPRTLFNEKLDNTARINSFDHLPDKELEAKKRLINGLCHKQVLLERELKQANIEQDFKLAQEKQADLDKVNKNLDAIDKQIKSSPRCKKTLEDFTERRLQNFAVWKAMQATKSSASVGAIASVTQSSTVSIAPAANADASVAVAAK